MKEKNSKFIFSEFKKKSCLQTEKKNFYNQRKLFGNSKKAERGIKM